MWRVITLSVATILLAAPAQLEAKTGRSGGGTLPQLDIASGCKDISNADQGKTLNYERCMTEEHAARDQIRGEWASSSASVKELCLDLVKPPALQSYVTLQGCLDMAKYEKNR